VGVLLLYVECISFDGQTCKLPRVALAVQAVAAGAAAGPQLHTHTLFQRYKLPFCFPKFGSIPSAQEADAVGLVAAGTTPFGSAASRDPALAGPTAAAAEAAFEGIPQAVNDALAPNRSAEEPASCAQQHCGQCH
jgi:hypothetical protein